MELIINNDKIPLTNEEYDHIKEVVKEVYYAAEKLNGLLDGGKRTITEEQYDGIARLFTHATAPYMSCIGAFRQEVIKSTNFENQVASA